LNWYKNRTVEEVDAHFASVIAASLKAQGAAICQRQVVPPAGAATLDEANDNMPSLLPPGVCNSDAKDNNDPPVEASIASCAGVQTVAVKAPVSSAAQIKLHLVSCHLP